MNWADIPSDDNVDFTIDPPTFSPIKEPVQNPTPKKKCDLIPSRNGSEKETDIRSSTEAAVRRAIRQDLENHREELKRQRNNRR